MKIRTMLVILALSMFSISAFAQTQVNVVSQGKSVSVTASEALKLTNSPVTAVIVNGVQTTGTLGTLSFTTGTLVSGNFQTGATLGSGGQFIIDAPGYVDYVGNFSSASWLELTYANGNHAYQLTGFLTSMEGNGGFICTTDILPKQETFTKSVVMNNCSFGATLN
jgi:hypothetical protein